jgi:hypothetical protein
MSESANDRWTRFMTEQWPTSHNIREMAEVTDHFPKRLSNRKLRLFAVACCRRVWHLMTDEHSRRIVEGWGLSQGGFAGADKRERS